MKNDGYVKIDDVMPYLLKILAYWGGEDVYKALEKMPIESNLRLIGERYIKKSNVMRFLREDLAYWGANDVSNVLKRMPTLNGLGIKLLGKWL